jgi:predicted AlkP superfamily phosphohydrolase/phosphomutase
MDGSPAVPGPPELTDGIRQLYAATDRAIGAILGRAREGTNVFVISSVGMKGQYPAAGLGEAFCRQLGYQASPAASGTPSRSVMATLRRTMPTGLRDRLSGLLPRSVQERLIGDKYEAATDWTRTEAFCIPSYYTTFLRVNLRGREPRGIVEPGAEYERLLQRIERDLAQLIDPVTSKPAVREVARATHLFGGGPPETLPDLFVEWAEATHFMERLEHPRAQLRQVPCEFHRDSDHSRYGFIAAAGPDIAGRGDVGELSPLDLVPTFLQLLGEARPASLPGRPHPGILGAAR